MQVGPGDDGFNITSPFYPNQFPLTQDCTWRLSTTTPGSIFVDFLDLDTGRYHDELYIGGANATILFDIDDQLESMLLLESLKTSKLLMFTGRQFPKTLVLHQNPLKLGWDASFWTAGGRGFWIHVSWISRNGTHINVNEIPLFYLFSLQNGRCIFRCRRFIVHCRRLIILCTL